MEQLSTAAFFSNPFAASGDGIPAQLLFIWDAVRAPVIAPLLNVIMVLCSALSVMQFVERIYMGVVIIAVKLLRRTPEKRYKWEAIEDDAELGNSVYPMVLVQIPMFNEKEVLCFFFTLFFV